MVNGADTGSYYVSGYDIYGYAMSENISGTTISTGGILLGRKAFKFISSVVPKGTIASTSVSVGTQDVYGFPIRADGFCDVGLVFNDTYVTSSTGFTKAVTAAATTASGDVRGTYALQGTLSNGVRTLCIENTPRAANVGSATGLFGVTQA